MELIVYEKQNALQEKYTEGNINPKALKIAVRFYELCYDKFKKVISEPELFNLFLKTFNSYATNNIDTQFKDNDEFIDAVNMFDDILVALSSKKGLNLCKVYLLLEPSKYESNIIRNKKYLEWDY